MGGLRASGVTRRQSIRRFFDRLSLPSRQKPGQDGIGIALFLPDPNFPPGLPLGTAMQQ